MVKNLLPAFGLLAVACADEVALDNTTQAVVAANGVSLNGVSLNGVSLNGVSLNGVSLNGVSLNGVSLNGVSLNGVSLNGVSLNGVSLNGTSLTGTRTDTGELLSVGAVGTTLSGTLSNGSTLALHVESAAQLSGGQWTYGITYDSDLGRLPLCGDPTITALAVPGTWNTQSGVAGGGAYTASTTEFTFACRGRSIAKCVELGYDPTTRVPQLASCVRLLRADYCGDGTPHTTNGTTLNLYDNVGVQADTEAWVVEAEWTPAGARCISNERESRFLNTNLQTPACLLNKTLSVSRSCGRFGNGAVLISELPEESVTTTTTKTLSKTTSLLR